MRALTGVLGLLLAATAHGAGTTAAYNEQRNLYFGDTHVHTALSFDAYLSANRVGLEGAYRFARGEPVKLSTGETAQLSQPLDFVVMTDHAESYGLFETCARDDLSEGQRNYCKQFETPSRDTFLRLRNAGLKRPPKRMQELCGGEYLPTCLADARTTWRQVVTAADSHNEPGKFSAFAGYEYSPVLPKRGKIHRNVIFRNSNTPNRVVSAFDAVTVLDLWETLEAECTDGCEFLTIPHNMNKSWGIAYSGRTIDGDAYEDQDWALRGRNEPIAEIFQIKGSSECGYDLGASDEECNFELVVPLCEGEQEAGCSGRSSFAREGLKEGLKLQERLGYNPLQFGFIGSTDTHDSTPGRTDENNYRGSSPATASAQARLGWNTDKRRTALKNKEIPRSNPGGLAAVWATENTRDAIFDALKRRETYATSGTRIQLRFYAGWQLDPGILSGRNLLQKADKGGVPMGGVMPAVTGEAGSPTFLVWAMQDPNAAPLQRIQMVKAWVQYGQAQEKVVDIACSDGMSPLAGNGRCPDNGATVSLKDCSISADRGAQELKTTWQDPDFDAEQAAVYYVRVLENPTCRWSTYDAISLGRELPVDLPPTIRERAWSSPIWYTPE